MDGITVASTTDTMEDVNQAAGIEEADEKLTAQEPAAETKPVKAETTEPKAETKPSKSAAQKRFDALTREIHDLRSKLEAKTAEPEKPAQEVAEEPKETPKPVFADFQSKGKTYDDYIEALTDWKVEQIEVRKAQEAEKAAENERIQATIGAWNERKEAAKEKYEDFDETLSENVPIYPAVMNAIIELENGPDVAYYLGKHRDFAADLLKMTATRAIARIGQLSAELGDGQKLSDKPDAEIAEEEEEDRLEARQEPAPKPKAKSAAPAPIKPVGGSATKSSVPMDELPYSEYRKLRDQQQKARYRR